MLFFGDLERWFDLAREAFGKGGGDSLGERSFIVALSSLDIIVGAGEREDDLLLDTGSFLDDVIGVKSFLPEELGDFDVRRFILIFTLPEDAESTFSPPDC